MANLTSKLEYSKISSPDKTIVNNIYRISEYVCMYVCMYVYIYIEIRWYDSLDDLEKHGYKYYFRESVPAHFGMFDQKRRKLVPSDLISSAASTSRHVSLKQYVSNCGKERFLVFTDLSTKNQRDILVNPIVRNYQRRCWYLRERND